jgi:hypothetical protein
VHRHIYIEKRTKTRRVGRGEERRRGLTLAKIIL